MQVCWKGICFYPRGKLSQVIRIKSFCFVLFHWRTLLTPTFKPFFFIQLIFFVHVCARYKVAHGGEKRQQRIWLITFTECDFLLLSSDAWSWSRNYFGVWLQPEALAEKINIQPRRRKKNLTSCSDASNTEGWNIWRKPNSSGCNVVFRVRVKV